MSEVFATAANLPPPPATPKGPSRVLSKSIRARLDSEPIQETSCGKNRGDPKGLSRASTRMLLPSRATAPSRRSMSGTKSLRAQVLPLDEPHSRTIDHTGQLSVSVQLNGPKASDSR